MDQRCEKMFSKLVQQRCPRDRGAIPMVGMMFFAGEPPAGWSTEKTHEDLLVLAACDCQMFSHYNTHICNIHKHIFFGHTSIYIYAQYIFVKEKYYKPHEIYPEVWLLASLKSLHRHCMGPQVVREGKVHRPALAARCPRLVNNHGYWKWPFLIGKSPVKWLNFNIRRPCLALAKAGRRLGSP